MDWYGLIIFIIILSVFSVLLYDSFRNRLALKKSHATVTQLLADKQLVLEQMERLANERSLNNNKDFVSFLTDSREWAFSYIEQVHKSMESFTTKIERHVKENPEILEIVNELYDSIMPQDNPDT